MGSTV